MSFEHMLKNCARKAGVDGGSVEGSAFETKGKSV
jgi:hypothetical protein